MPVRIVGSNFGVDVSLITVKWNGAPLPDVRIVQPHTALQFQTPPGQVSKRVVVTCMWVVVVMIGDAVYRVV